MRYNYLRRRLDVSNPLLEDILREYVYQGKAEIIEDNSVVFEVNFLNVTDKLGNPKFCKVIYSRIVDELMFFV